MKSISYWEKNSFYHSSDVIIIGSGIVGLNCAIHLKEQQPALKVSILERGILPSGASTKNAGFSTFGSVSELIEQLKRTDEQGLVAITERRWKGLQQLISRTGAEKIEHFQWGGNEIFFEKDELLFETCQQEMPYFNGILKHLFGNEAIFSLRDDLISAFGFNKVSHLIHNKFEGQLNTGKMMEALLDMAYRLGVKVYNGVEVDKIEHQNQEIHCILKGGEVFTSKKIVLCTNAFTSHFLPQLDVVPGRGQVLITAPIKNLKLKGTFHFDLGYYYFRNIDNRVLFGGGRNIDFKAEETTEFGITPSVQNELERVLKEVILPNQDYSIEQRWSGIMAFGKELDPIVQEVEPNIICAVRCNGMGVALGSLLGVEAAEIALV